MSKKPHDEPLDSESAAIVDGFIAHRLDGLIDRVERAIAEGDDETIEQMRLAVQRAFDTTIGRDFGQ